MATTTVVTTDSFQEEVLESPIPVVVDLWAPWCGPCRAMAPVLEELAREFVDRVKVVKVNVDQEPALAQAFRVQGIPMLAVLQGNKVVDRQVGFAGKPGITALFQRAASRAA